MNTPRYTENGLLILTLDQEEQILQQLETALKLMQGKIFLEQAQPVLGTVGSQSERRIVFNSKTVRTENGKYDRDYVSYAISLFGMKKEQLQEKNSPFDLYLNEADFDFTKIDGIAKEVIVKRLGLQNEEYIGYFPSTAYSERESFAYRYSMPKNSQTPYETSIQIVFWDEGRQTGEDRKTKLPLFKGATELKSISISRFK